MSFFEKVPTDAEPSFCGTSIIISGINTGTKENLKKVYSNSPICGSLVIVMLYASP
jgi:hypothetical protein